MKIEYVNPINLNLLEDAFNNEILNNNGEKSAVIKDFGKNVYLLLSHIKISFVISEISIYEAYMLKRFCGGNLIDLETYIDDNKIDSSKYPITHRNVQSLFLLNKSINEDNDVEVKPGVLLFPAKCIEKKCIATLQGYDLLTIFGALAKTPECFFIKLNNALKQNPDSSREEIINNLLIESFFTNFYSYMANKTEYIDLLTDSTLDFHYLSYAKEKSNVLISLSHINTLYGTVSFINTDDEIYKSSFENINKNKELLKLKNDPYTMETTDIFFLCNSSFYSFIEAFLYLPSGSILESTDIKMVYTSDQFIIPKEMMKYKTRVASIIEKMKSERMSVVSNSTVDIYNLIPLNTRVQYSIKFKLSEISDIINKWENAINNNLYDDENNYLTKEIKKIITGMKDYAIAVYKTIMH